MSLSRRSMLRGALGAAVATGVAVPGLAEAEPDHGRRGLRIPKDKISI